MALFARGTLPGSGQNLITGYETLKHTKAKTDMAKKKNNVKMTNLEIVKLRTANKKNRRAKKQLRNGDTLTMAPVAMAQGVTTQQPRFVKYAPSGRSCRIIHRELFMNATMNTAYTVSSTAINPGLSNMFPWLAYTAQNWEFYKFHSLRFDYINRTSTSTVGAVMMGFDYDATDIAPSTEQLFMAIRGATEHAAWENCSCVADMNIAFGGNPRKYVRTTTVPTGRDQTTYDIGNFLFATTDGASQAVTGKIYVSYDVEFFEPQPPPTGQGASGSITQGTGNVGVANIFGNTPVIVGPFTATTNGVIFQTSGNYQLTLIITGTGGTFTGPNFNLVGGGTINYIVPSNIQFLNANTGGASQGVLSLYINGVTAGTVVNWSTFNSFWATVTAGTVLYISQTNV